VKRMEEYKREKEGHFGSDHRGKENSMKNLPQPREQDPFATKVILLVEDDLLLSEFLAGMIGMFVSYEVVSANNAFQALSLTKDVRPDLFLFDYQLPGINGLELYQQLHSQPTFAKIPVLFVSAVAPKEAFEKQHLPYIGKPFDMDDLLYKISWLVTHGQPA